MSGLKSNGLKSLGLAAISALAFGCGGVGNSASKGSFQMQIKWPSSKGLSRAIPKLATSLDVQVASGLATTDKVIARPTDGSLSTTTTFDDVSVGPVSVDCTALGDPVNGVAPILAIAIATVDLQPGPGNVVILDLVSTIDHIVASAPGLSAGTLTMRVGDQVTVTTTAYISNSAIAPIGAGNLTYATVGDGFTVTGGNGNTATINATSQGSGTVTVTEAESGRSTTFTVNISGTL